jgi:hypothetical protein
VRVQQHPKTGARDLALRGDIIHGRQDKLTDGIPISHLINHCSRWPDVYGVGRFTNLNNLVLNQKPPQSPCAQLLRESAQLFRSAPHLLHDTSCLNIERYFDFWNHLGRRHQKAWCAYHARRSPAPQAKSLLGDDLNSNIQVSVLASGGQKNSSVNAILLIAQTYT